jgi:hypothetical protein
MATLYYNARELESFVGNLFPLGRELVFVIVVVGNVGVVVLKADTEKKKCFRLSIKNTRFALRV